MGFPGGTNGKEPTCQCRLDVGDTGLIPGSGSSPGGGHDNPPQYSCLENPMDRGAWQAALHEVAHACDSPICMCTTSSLSTPLLMDMLVDSMS